MRDSEEKRLLVVDDDPGMCRAVARVLGPLYSVATALSLAEARQKHVVIAPGEFEFNTVRDRRPELYGMIVQPPAEA